MGTVVVMGVVTGVWKFVVGCAVGDDDGDDDEE